MQRQVRRSKTHRGKESSKPGRNGEAHKSSGARENRAFEQQLPEQPGPRRSHRDPHSHFVGARGNGGKEQIRNVYARDSQNKERNGEKSHGKLQVIWPSRQ